MSRPTAQTQRRKARDTGIGAKAVVMGERLGHRGGAKARAHIADLLYKQGDCRLDV